MEIRRVQLTGGSSYVITLPKEWIKSANIKKNDPVGIFMQSDGSLLITQKMNRDPEQRMKEFKVDDKTKQIFFLRKLIGAYIAGYTSIKITSDRRITHSIRKTVRDFTQRTIGQEVVEETEKSVTIKDIFNPAELPFNRSIKRMHIIVKGMYEDAMIAVQKNNKILAEDVISRDNDVDRLHWLTARQYNTLLKNISFAEKMGVTIELASVYFLISRIIERIADHVIIIANNIIDTGDNIVEKSILEKLKNAGILSLEILNKSIGSFFKRNIKEANENIDAVIKLRSQCEEINNLTLNLDGAIAISLGYISESTRRIGEYAEDISEHVINYLIDEDKNSDKQSQTKPPLLK